MLGNAFSLSYHAKVVFEQLIPFVKAHFPADVFHEIMRITDAWEKNAHDQNEQTTGCPIKSIDKKLSIGLAHSFSLQFLNLFGFSISVSFVLYII